MGDKTDESFTKTAADAPGTNHYSRIFGIDPDRSIFIDVADLYTIGKGYGFYYRIVYGDLRQLRDRTGRTGYGDLLVTFRARNHYFIDSNRRAGCDHNGDFDRPYDGEKDRT